MSEDNTFESAERQRTSFTDTAEMAPDFAQGTQQQPATYDSSLLHSPSIQGRGNAPVRTAIMQRMQQTSGNRAVQRFLSAQRSAAQTTATADEDIAHRIESRSGGGSSLDTGVQRTLEQGLGADMSGVRVHTDGEADHLARSVDSVAFTTGNDIFFRQGAYNPESQQGMHLLAHEATHTVQQSQGPVSGTPSAGGVSISDPSDSYEQAAEQAAANIVAGKTADAQPSGGGGSSAPVQRAVPEEEEMPPAQTMRSSLYVQRQAGTPEEEEMPPAQTMRSSLYVQRTGVPEDEELPAQTMRDPAAVQRHASGDEEEG